MALALAPAALRGVVVFSAWLAAIPADYNLQKLKSYGVRSVRAIDPYEKMHPNLTQASFPAHALHGDKIELVIQYMPQVDRYLIEQQLVDLYADLTESYPANNLVYAQVPLDKIARVADLPAVSWVEIIAEPGQPEDTRGKSLHRANVINSEYTGGAKYDGSGVLVASRDNGMTTPHIDFEGRADRTLASQAGTHGDGVAGIMAGAGNLDPTMQGMAPGSDIIMMNYVASFLDQTLPLHQTDNLVITNSSYSNGCNAGYTTITQTVDDQAFNNPSLLHVFSAGNSNNNDCGYGAGDQWGNITGGHKMGKNVIATANLFANDVLATSSSRGPANDGRLKPDIAANGQNQNSTGPNNTYQVFGGTSGAAPGIAGIAAQLYQAYKEMHNGQDPEGSLIKAAMMNTAHDLGNVGPDFSFGFGRVNARRALELIQNNDYLQSTAIQGDSNLHSISIPANVKEARIMLYWMDPPAATFANKALINDLDLNVIDLAGGTNLPLVLDPTPNPAALNTPASPGIDNLNNVEQVRLTDPASGTYTVNVKGSMVPQGPQSYYILYTFLYDDIVVTYPQGGEGVVPGETVRIHWDALQDPSLGNFTVEYSTDDGNSWNILSSVVNPNRYYLDWFVPTNINSDQARIRVSRNSNNVSGQSIAPFSILSVPQNLTVAQACPTYTRLIYGLVNGATEYEISVLGAKYMDSVATSTSNSADVAVNPIGDQWFSVRAIGPNGGKGRRSIAIFRGTGLVNCPLNNDMSLEQLISPTNSALSSCETNDIPVTMIVKNSGTIAQSNIPIFYQVNNDPVVSDTFPGNLAPNGQSGFTFDQLLTLSQAGVYEVKTWTGLLNDEAAFNDTAVSRVEVLNSSVISLPYTEDFETLTNCSTESNCGLEECELTNGWVNLTNGFVDDIDWRVNKGSTPSNSTGPPADHKPGNDDGKYLYLEASGGCIGEEAIVWTPCIDLTNTLSPEMSFWYHFFGNNTGTLVIEARLNGLWVSVGNISGNQGDLWRERKINLGALTGRQTILRFRGTTGTGFASDMALDDIAIYDRAAAPVADFAADAQITCVGNSIQFTDLSVNTPTSWEWEVLPGNVAYVGGTNQNSQNPEIAFTANGIYTVSLKATNAAGDAVSTKTSYIEVIEGTVPNVIEDFESGSFPPSGWDRVNLDGSIRWEEAEVVGSDGNLTHTAFLDNINYAFGTSANDDLISLVVDLSASSQPELTFDVSYARQSNQLNDDLSIIISDDCGETFGSFIYFKGGATLATSPNSPGEWIPSQASDWRRDTVDLSPYVGNTIRLNFRNTSDTGNRLYIDNIQITEQGTAAPSAAIAADLATGCEDGIVTFSDASGGNITSWNWDFGPDATPSTATGAGPHQITYASAGSKTVSLTVSDGTNSDVSQYAIQVTPLPDPAFSSSNVGAVTTFTNTTVNGTTYSWDFGDGNSSMDANPEHTYAANGVYTVSLTATNDCGSETITQEVNMTTVGIDPSLISEIKVFPNPNQGIFDVQVKGSSARNYQFRLLDLRGRTVWQNAYQNRSSDFTESINVSGLTSGVYLLQITADASRETIKVMVE
ncbi:MAG: PKD domain-containing protein [Bacteroidota bacterium]